MEFRINISSDDDNCAMDPIGTLAFVLKALTSDVEHGDFSSGDSIPLYDFNGNKIGTADFVEI